MTKTIMITGATDGLGRETALRLAAAGHSLIIHGRNETKLATTAKALRSLPGAGPVMTCLADLSDLRSVADLGRSVRAQNERIDVLINNAGVFRIDHTISPEGLDLRFVVNTLAPALLTRLLLPSLPADGRVVHLSSAAQAPVDIAALQGHTRLDAMDAYAQSKLALTIWSQAFARERGMAGPVSVAVNPGSLLATEMVRKGFGVSGNDIGIGAEILSRAALSEEFATASGRYFDNDSGRFAAPHPQAADPKPAAEIVAAIEGMIAAQLTDSTQA